MFHFAPAGFLAFYNRNSQSWHFASVYKKRQFCKKTPQIPTFHLSFFQPAKTFSPDFVCLFFQVLPSTVWNSIQNINGCSPVFLKESIPNPPLQSKIRLKRYGLRVKWNQFPAWFYHSMVCFLLPKCVFLYQWCLSGLSSQHYVYMIFVKQCW